MSGPLSSMNEQRKKKGKENLLTIKENEEKHLAKQILR